MLFLIMLLSTTYIALVLVLCESGCIREVSIWKEIITDLTSPPPSSLPSLLIKLVNKQRKGGRERRREGEGRREREWERDGEGGEENYYSLFQ